MRFLGTLVAVLVLLGSQAGAVIIDEGDGTGNTSAPADDPGFANVGTVNGATAIYLGQNWVLSAKHVGGGDTTFEGVTYEIVPGTYTRIDNVDLAMWQIYGNTGLPELWISEETAYIGDEVLMIGKGRNRGAEFTWEGHDGYLWGPGATIRWGTSTVVIVKLGKWTMAKFLPGGSIAAVGDSGGAVFVKVQTAACERTGPRRHCGGGEWELTGVMASLSRYGGQPSATALFGNITVSIDLSGYKQEILEVIELPEPGQTSQLAVGVLAIALAHRRMRRRS